MRVDRRQLQALLGGVLLLLFQGVARATPAIESWETAAGARVLFVPSPDLPMVDIRVVFDAGSARDGELPGLSVLTNALLTDAAGAWSADQVAERLESVGAEIDSAALRDMAWVSLRSLTDPAVLGVALDTLEAVLGRPRFEAADIERSRQAMGVALRRDEQSPGKVASKAFYRAVFGSHPYAIPREGTHQSLQAITREQIEGHYRRHYVARNAVVAIVGAVDRAQAETIAGQVTRGLEPGEPAPELPSVPPLEKGVEVRTSFPSTQSHILLGQPGMHRGDPDYFTLYVGNHIFGGSGLVSLLTDEVREKRGLSYSVYSFFSPMRGDGPFTIGAQTQNARVDEALAVIRDTLQRYIDQGPSEAELQAAKQNITGGFPLNIASNSDIVSYIAMIGFYGLPLDYLERFVDNVEEVSAEGIREAFQRRLHPERMVTVLVGNGQKKQPAD